ncbi:MAG: DUF1648 domain-containing protein [Saprospiraceae bacterium]
METRPLLNIELTTGDKIIEIAGWCTLGFLWLFIILIYDNLPDIIPTHFNGMGQINNYGDKMTLFFLPVICSMIFISFSVLNRYPHKYNYPVKITPENALAQYTNATRMLRFLKLTIGIIFFLVVYMVVHAIKNGNSEEITIWMLPLVFVLIISPITYFLFKAIKLK